MNTGDRVERRLAAILAADVVGYSRLMGADEEGTLRRLQEHRRALIDPKMSEHRGRIVKTTGDGMLVEFPSVVDAVRCAVEVQRAMVERNGDTSEDQRIVFRVGVNLGDVIVENDDIFGDGVNVAARLEALAEPGGICISRTVRNQVRDKLPYEFEDRGEQSVKNIARPVRVDALGAAAVAATPLVEVKALPPQPAPAGRGASRGRVAIVAGLVAIVGLGAAGWWVWPGRQAPPATTGATKPTPRLSMVVLPFANLSNDPDQEYFADGVTDDLTTDLSRIPGSFVIARTTAFTYKGKAVDVKQIGKDLGVRYVLEGSIRRTGNQVQTNVQLIDAESGAHLWARRFDIDRADLAKTQDDIVGQLARALQVELTDAAARRIEKEKPNPEAEDFVMRGWAWYNRVRTQATQDAAQEAFERALAIDPQSVDAKIGLATVLTDYVVTFTSHVVNGVTISREQDIARAEPLLAEALKQDPNNQKLYFALGRLRRMQNRLTESRIELERGIELDRNSVSSLLQLGITLILLGQPEAALTRLERAQQLTPLDPNAGFFYFWLGYGNFLTGHVDKAIELLKKGRAANPNLTGGLEIGAAMLGFRGDIDEAKVLLAEYQKKYPDRATLAQMRAKIPYWNGSPEYVALREKTVDVGLRRAGLGDE